MRTPPLQLIGLSLVTVCFGGCAAKPVQPGPVQSQAQLPVVQTSFVSLGSIDQSIIANGTLTVPRDREATISAAVSGILSSLSITVGQVVAQGQVVGGISTQSIAGQIQQAEAGIAQGKVQIQQAEANALQQQAQTEAGIAQAKAAVGNGEAAEIGDIATLTGAEAGLKNAQDNLTRENTLFQDGLVAAREVDTAKLAVNTAQAQVDAQRQAVVAQQQSVNGLTQAVAAAKAGVLLDRVKQQDVAIARQQVRNAAGALETSQAQLAFYTLRAPLSGRVTNVGASTGENVDNTTKIATISNLDRLQLTMNIPAENSRAVHPGQRILFQTDGLPDRSFSATISVVSQQVNSASNTVSATAFVPNFSHQLNDDQTVNGRIIVAHHLGVTLCPKAAVLLASDQSTSVAVVGADQKIHITTVTVGIRQGDIYEIIHGLQPGDRVAVSGAYGMPDGTQVMAVSSSVSGVATSK